MVLHRSLRVFNGGDRINPEQESVFVVLQAGKEMGDIRILILDEYAAVCQALAARLSAFSGITVVGATHIFAEGLQLLRLLEPDVVLLELKVKGELTLDPAGRISQVSTVWPGGIIILTSFLDELERAAALQAGARRYLLKNINSEQLIAEIRAVADEAGRVPAGRPLPLQSEGGKPTTLSHGAGFQR